MWNRIFSKKKRWQGSSRSFDVEEEVDPFLPGGGRMVDGFEPGGRQHKYPRRLVRGSRKLSPNRGKLSISDVGSSKPTAPSRPPAGYPGPSSPLTPELDFNDPRSSLNTHVALDGSRSISARLERVEREGINLNIPPSSSGSDRKKTIIGATRLMLQTAAFVLKFSPIPKLDEIPNLLLTWLQVYETLDGNDTNLKELNGEFQKAYKTILQPLQMWTSQTSEIPPEVILLVEDFHSDLEEQIKQIQMLASRKITMRVVLGADIAREISNVKACIASALSRFATMATTLNLLNTIRASVNNELSKLPKADAEYHRVKSKSECLETTRREICSSVFNHLRAPRSRFVWLRGSPGTGKTAISIHVASILDSQDNLAASFFWDKNRKGTGLDSIERFPSTLALQLAAFNAEYKSLLIKQLRQPASLKGLQGSAAEKEMKAWVINPMHELRAILSSREDRFVIVLDGLDECGDPESLRSLMKLILLLDELPSTFAILVSCRPEPQVVSAWAQAKTQEQPIVVAGVDVNKIAWDENFYTIRRMVEEGLQDCIRDSPWKPSNMDLDSFTSACRELPIIASIRIREVRMQAHSGSALKSEFEYFLDLTDAPKDLNSEYLRLMRRAYMSHSSSIRPWVIRNYQEVVGTIIVAKWQLSVYDISQLTGLPEDEVCSTLRPISSIVDLPSDRGKGVKFYHATVKEFIAGVPIGKKQDKLFFISDKNGYFLGLRLLRFVNDAITRNGSDIPTEHPLGDEKRWQHSLSKKQPSHVRYAFQNLFGHLDPWLLFSPESNELQREFQQFLEQNLFSFCSMVWGAAESVCQPGWHHFHNHKSMKLLKEAEASFGYGNYILGEPTPWHYYRSSLPFTPSSSRLYRLYGHLSDPVRVFSVDGEFAGHFIPLSKDALGARKVMNAKLSEPKKVDEGNNKEVNYEAELLDNDICSGIVTCAALSRDGCYVALGFGSGIIEVASIDDQCTIYRFQSIPPNPPIWIEFIIGNVRLATEDTEGNIVILGDGTHSKLGTLPRSHYPAITAVSDAGALIVRVLRNPEENWYEKVTLLCTPDDPSIQLLASPLSTPSLLPTAQSLQHHSNPSFPSRHMVGFSPRGRYVGAYDRSNAFVWSTDSCELIARFHVQDFRTWIINTSVVPPCSYLIPNSTSHQPSTLLTQEEETPSVQTSEPTSEHDLDESWLLCPFYDLSPSMGDSNMPFEVYSAAARGVLLNSPSLDPPQIWLNGKIELILPDEYHPITHFASNGEAWYGDRLIHAHRGVEDDSLVYLPQASKDGTRFLVQGKMRVPIVVDISQVI